MPVCSIVRLHRTVPRLSCRPAQPIESLAPHPRQHKTKRRATARFGVARRRPTAARAACSAAGLMLHLAAGGVQHDHVQHQCSSPRGRGEPDHPATRHQIRAFIDDHRRSRGPLHRPVRTAARVRAATGHAAGGGCCVATGRSRGACTPRHPAGTAASAVARRQGPGSAVAGDAGSRAASPPRTGTKTTSSPTETLIL